MTFLSDAAPDYFSNFSLAFISMFRITIGSIEWWFDAFPDSASGDSAGTGSLLFFISYVVGHSNPLIQLGLRPQTRI